MVCDRLEKSILVRAFRGELVPQDPNDEPASALLGSVRAEREKVGGYKQTAALSVAKRRRQGKKCLAELIVRLESGPVASRSCDKWFPILAHVTGGC